MRIRVDTPRLYLARMIRGKRKEEERKKEKSLLSTRSVYDTMAGKHHGASAIRAIGPIGIDLQRKKK